MKYDLRLKDKILLQFEHNTLTDIEIISVNPKTLALLPKGIMPTNKSLKDWLKQRGLCDNRFNYFELWHTLTNASKDNMLWVQKGYGISLEDSYWIPPSNYHGVWDDVNFFANNFSNDETTKLFLNLEKNTRSIFDGTEEDSENYSTTTHCPVIPQPDYMTDGMLPKVWQRVDNKPVLFKAGVEGFEPYCEWFCQQIAKVMGFKYQPYDLDEIEGKLVSTCTAFTDENTGYVPMFYLLDECNTSEVWDFYKSLGTEFVEDFEDMLVFDSLIYNGDRHYGNFGVLIDSDTNTIRETAPLFDNEHGLFGADLHRVLDYGDIEKLTYWYATPRLDFMDFNVQAWFGINERHRKGLEQLQEFEFERHPKYSPSEKAIKALETFVHTRAEELLKILDDKEKGIEY